MLEKNGKSLSERNVLPQKLVTEAMSGLTKFEPHKDLLKKDEKEEPPVKKDEPLIKKKDEKDGKGEPLKKDEKGEPLKKDKKDKKDGKDGNEITKMGALLIVF